MGMVLSNTVILQPINYINSANNAFLAKDFSAILKHKKQGNNSFYLSTINLNERFNCELAVIIKGECENESFIFAKNLLKTQNKHNFYCESSLPFSGIGACIVAIYNDGKLEPLLFGKNQRSTTSAKELTDYYAQNFKKNQNLPHSQENIQKTTTPEKGIVSEKTSDGDFLLNELDNKNATNPTNESELNTTDINNASDTASATAEANAEVSETAEVSESEKINQPQPPDAICEGDITQAEKEANFEYDDFAIAEENYYNLEKENATDLNGNSNFDTHSNLKETFNERIPFEIFGACGDNNPKATQTKNEERSPKTENGNCNNSKNKQNYFVTVKEKLFELFSKYPRISSLSNVIPQSEWIIASEKNSDFAVGIIKENGAVKYLAYGVKGNFFSPPNNSIFNCFVPESIFNNDYCGYWCVFQRAENGIKTEWRF